MQQGKLFEKLFCVTRKEWKFSVVWLIVRPVRYCDTVMQVVTCSGDGGVGVLLKDAVSVWFYIETKVGMLDE